MSTENTAIEQEAPYTVLVVARLPFWLGLPNVDVWVTVDDEAWQLCTRNDHVAVKARRSLERNGFMEYRITREADALRIAADLATRYEFVDIDWDVRTMIFVYPQITTATKEDAQSQFRERDVDKRLFLYLNEMIDAYRAADMGQERSRRAGRLSDWDVPNALVFVMRGDSQVAFTEVPYRRLSRTRLQSDTCDQETVETMVTFLQDPELPSPAMTLLAEAYSAWERGNYRAAVIDAYVAVEEQSVRTLKAALSTPHSPIESIDAFLGEVGKWIRATERCDKILESVCGRSLRQENRRLWNRFDKVRTRRNRAVHRGEWPDRRQSSKDVLTCHEVTAWLASVAADLVRESEEA